MKEFEWSANKTKTEDDNESNDSDRVITTNNKIYFYSEVSRPKVLTLNKSITNVGLSLQNRANTLGLEELGKIHLHINSYGGSIFAGLAATDCIIRSPVDVVTIIDGCAASAQD